MGSLIPATDSRVLILGRYCTSGSIVRFDWPATTIELRVRRSRRVWLRMNGNKNYFSISCNGCTPQILTALSRKVIDYSLPLGQSKSEDDILYIRITKRTEAAALYGIFGSASGVVSLEGIILEDDGELLEPFMPRSRLLEFYGDSDTCGFGNEGKRTSSKSFLALLRSASCAHEQDASRAFPALVGAALDANTHNLAWSGIGACWNAPMCGREAMDAKWDRLIATDAAAGSILSGQPTSSPVSSSVSSSNAHHQQPPPQLPDAVVIYLGGNDFYTMGQNPPVGLLSSLQRTEAKFIEGFASLLRAIRAARPSPIPILLLECDAASGSCLESAAAQAHFSKVMGRLLRAVVECVADPYMFVVPLCGQPPISHADDTDFGVIGHWSLQGHAKVATALAKEIGQMLGWKVDLHRCAIVR